MSRIYLALLSTLVTSLCLAPPAGARDAADSPQVIDDRQIRMRFERELGKLKDEGKAPEPKDLQKQLGERKKHALDLSKIGGLKRSDGTPSVYAMRKSSVLCFGHIYKCDKCTKWHGNLAGGFVLTPDGIAVTNYHVMESDKAGAFGAMTADGKVHLVEEVLAGSKANDIAIVRLAGDGFDPAPIRADEPVGARVSAISHPQGRFYTFSEGIVSRYYKQRGKNGESERMAITADFAKGSSGSPIFSADGTVVGMVSSTNSIYYDRDSKGVETNLQMVIKSCIPSRSILKLLSQTETDSGDQQASR